jgi:hypothetical protein
MMESYDKYSRHFAIVTTVERKDIKVMENADWSTWVVWGL